MKKLLAIAGIVLFFMILVALLLFKLFYTGSKQAPAVQQDPFKNVNVSSSSISTTNANETAVRCLTWYVRARAQGATPQTISIRPEAQQCFTSNFINAWNAPIEDSGIDPVLLSQDTLSTWETSVTARVIGQTYSSSDEEVTLGTNDEKYILTAHIIRGSDGMWRIDSVSNPATDDR